jgi:hypothetical protein
MNSGFAVAAGQQRTSKSEQVSARSPRIIRIPALNMGKDQGKVALL